MFLALLTLSALADEGMWLPEQLPAVGPAFTDRGLELDPAKLADPLQAPLGAIVSLGFCSASFVSPDGLIATNHHCVEGFLQYNSSGEANRHRDGFLAGDRAGELSVGPAGRVWVVEKIEDVTAKMTAGIKKRTSDAARNAALEDAEKRLIAACERQPNRRCRVAGYDGGGSYRLITALELKDIRLVYAPAMSLGQFGGDVDNWMWPRHSGDFALLRAYVAPDGSAAAYAEGNVPYKPKHWLEIDPTGAEPDSFVMVAGYPGRTNRHARARSLAWMAREYLPLQRDLLTMMAGILQQHADADPEAAARLGASISSLQNGLKNSDGLLVGLKRGGLVEKREAHEAEILAWVAKDPALSREIGPALEEQAALLDREHAEAVRELLLNWATRSADLLGVATSAIRWADERQKPDIKRELGYQDRDVERRRASFEALDKSLHLPSDRAVFGAILERYGQLPADARIASLDAWIAARGGLGPALDALYADPALARAEERLKLLELDAAALRASDDPWVSLALAIEAWAGPRREKKKADRGAHQRLDPAWYRALDAWHRAQGRTLYQDANSTLRITLGHVAGYAPQDGLIATPQTTVAGFAAKVGDAPFDAPADVVARAATAPKSRFADAKLGDVPVNFLATLDITGGNSGSAVLDGRGRFVGLAFDGNWESIASDWIFLPEVTRTICVDVRFLGWVLEGTPGAAPLLAELGLSAE